ncbi:MAG: acetyl-CoA acetyltransferase [Deltaproteobacteria bacterium]|uniref:Acetyl-CoA acetyltransferase n=1 Tax=Candidatus Zymogenus saltonus TaxID=2844893 RepID=A0A9D8KC69_9DELT|nr:acetyl-CoA acetyltransferase [Candidatus Zymogenus saltonus]
MASGIKDKVAILGMGCTRFGERWDVQAEDLMVEAYTECMEDAKIEKKDIDASWFGSCFDEVNVGKSAISLPMTLKLPYIGATRVENFCASGTESFRGAVYAVASGAADIALAMGAEKLKDTGYGGLPDFGTAMGTFNRLIMPNATAPGSFALMATGYCAKYNVSPEDLKTALAKISAKSHANGAKNPKAHLRKEVTVDQILSAPIIAWPLGLFDCCGVSDGAACAIVTTPEIAKKIKPNEDPTLVKALQIAITSGEEMWYDNWDGAHVETTTRAAAKAYAEAGVKTPRDEISMMEVHDCFSITELATYEDLQISPRGKAIDDINDGFYNLDGKIPCQPDGGLKCFGHPIGASGLRMLYEMYNQLNGRAGDRQIKDPKLGLTHNLGGFPAMSVCSVAIIGK